MQRTTNSTGLVVPQYAACQPTSDIELSDHLLAWHSVLAICEDPLVAPSHLASALLSCIGSFCNQRCCPCPGGPGHFDNRHKEVITGVCTPVYTFS